MGSTVIHFVSIISEAGSGMGWFSLYCEIGLIKIQKRVTVYIMAES